MEAPSLGLLESYVTTGGEGSLYGCVSSRALVGLALLGNTSSFRRLGEWGLFPQEKAERDGLGAGKKGSLKCTVGLGNYFH